MYKLMTSLAITMLLSLLLTTNTSAQDNYKAGHEGWLVSIDEAYAQSQESGKPILANFTGSDWCGWCKRLSANVFNHQEFSDWAKDNVVLLELDFPKRTSIPKKYKDQNDNLRRAFKVTGYPTIWVFNLGKNKETNAFEIQALGKTGYAKNVAEFTAGVNKMLGKS